MNRKFTAEQTAISIDYTLKSVGPPVADRVQEMTTPVQLRRFASFCAALAIERAGLTVERPRLEEVLAIVRTVDTDASPPAEELDRLWLEVKAIADRYDLTGFKLLEAHEAGLGPTYKEYLDASHKAQAAESVYCALFENPLLAAVDAMSSARWTTPPRVETEDFLNAADRALAEDNDNPPAASDPAPH